MKVLYEYRFMLRVKVFDSFLTIDDLVEFIKYRLNMKHCCELGEVLLIDKKECKECEVSNEVRNEA